MSRVTYEDVFYNPIIEENAKGFLDFNIITDDFTQNSSVGYVLKGMEYRPDLIANYYLGDCKFAWLITITNNFTNGIEDYYPGRKIKIPSKNIVEKYT